MNTEGQWPRWGRPPLALVPAPLAGRLTTVPLPGWLADLLDGPGTAAALTASAWERLPRDEAVLKRVRHHVRTLVGSLAFELRDVAIGTVAGGTTEPPGPTPWPLRARDALLRSGIRPDPHRRYTLTFGELLDVPYVGVRTALETAALLELALGPALGHAVEPRPAEPAVRRSVGSGSSTLPILRWGRPGCALLPRSLRRAFATTVLPSSVSRDLHLPADETALALDASVWDHADGLSRQAEEELLGLVDRGWVHALRIMDDPWPADHRPEDVPWPKRLRHGLSRAGLLAAARLERLTYGDLLEIRGVGRKSAIEFGVIADTLSPDPAGPVGDGVRQSFLAMSREGWTERVRADDLRFGDVVPPYAGSLRQMLQDAFEHPESRLAHALADALDRIRARAEEIGSEPIDLALARLATALGISRRDMALTAARLGWDAGGPRTLRELAAQHSLSRERVRQLVDRTTVRIGHPYLPQVERSVRLLAERAPVTDQHAAALLVEHGLSIVPIDPSSLRTLADLTGYDTTFRVDDCSGGVRLVLAAGSGATGMALAAARRLAAQEGVATVAQVQAALGARGHHWPTEEIAPLLRSTPGIELLDAEWYWVPDASAARHPLRDATRRMLSVTPQLDVETVRQGLARRSRYKRTVEVPPVRVLAAFYATHPDFVLRSGRIVEPAEPIDYRDVLTGGEQAFVEALRAAPTGLLSRAALRRAAAARGVRGDNFSSLTTHSPVLDHPARDAWCLRGAVVDPAALAALRTGATAGPAASATAPS